MRQVQTAAIVWGRSLSIKNSLLVPLSNTTLPPISFLYDFMYYTQHTHTSSPPHTAHPHTSHYVHTIKDPKRRETIKFPTGKDCNLQTKNHLTLLTLSVTMETSHNTPHLPQALSKEMSLAIKHTTQLQKERRHTMGDSLYKIFQACIVRGSNCSCGVGDIV